MRRFVRAHSRHDAATGLLSKRGFASELRKIAKRERRVGLLLGQVEGWNEIAGHWGHEPGGEALRRAFAAVDATMPKGTVLGRVGWLDYAAIVPEGHDALKVAESVRLAVSRAAVTDHGPPNRMTTALGVEPSPWIGLVDLTTVNRALGAALALGGNRIVGYRDGEYLLPPA